MGTVVGDDLPMALGGAISPIPIFALIPMLLPGPLDELREWLTAHNAAVMSVLLLVIGFSIAGKGLAGL